MSGKTIHRMIENFVGDFECADLFNSEAKFIGYNARILAEMLFLNMDRDENNFPVAKEGKITSFLSLDNREGIECCYIEFEWEQGSAEWEQDFRDITETALIFKCDTCGELVENDCWNDDEKICNICKKMNDEMIAESEKEDENSKRLTDLAEKEFVETIDEEEKIKDWEREQENKFEQKQKEEK